MNFERMPELAQIRVLSFLDARERLQAQRVSKRVKVLVENYLPLKSLCLLVSVRPVNLRWPFSEEVIKEQDRVYVPLKLYDSNESGLGFKKTNFRKLKKLHLEFDPLVGTGQRFLKQIEFLEELEVLSIYGASFTPQFCQQNFKKLKVLFLENCHIYGRDCLINVPNLMEYSHCCPLNGTITNFKNLERLQVLRTQIFDRKFPINQLSGLKRLICIDIDNSFRLDELPNLKLLELFPSKRETIEIVRRIAESKRCLKVFVFGFPIAELPTALANTNFPDFTLERSLAYYCPLRSTFLRQIAKNYSKIARPCSWPISLSYSSLVKSFREKVPRDFFRLYPEIKILTVSKKTEHFRLIRLLREHGGIEQLFLYDDCLGQEFFDNLGALSSLNTLKLIRFIKKIDFSFLSKLKNLRNLVLQSDIGLLISEGLESLEGCKHFELFIFMAVNPTDAEPFYHHAVRKKSFRLIKRSEFYILKTRDGKKIYQGEDIRESIAAINPELSRVLALPDIANS